VLATAANGRVSVQVEGENAPLSFKRQNLTPVAKGEAAASGGGTGEAATIQLPAGPVPSVKVDVLDEEHRKCESKLALLGRLTEPPGVSKRSGQITEALRGLLAAYEAHFAHEEALLDEHLYAGIEDAAGFSADKGARTSHFTDHQRMLAGVSQLLDDVASVSTADVLRLQLDFEQHATERELRTAPAWLPRWLLLLPLLPAARRWLLLPEAGCCS